MEKKHDLTCNDSSCLCGLVKQIDTYSKDSPLSVSTKNIIKNQYKDFFERIEKFKKEKKLKKSDLLKMLQDPIESNKLLEVINPVSRKSDITRNQSTSRPVSGGDAILEGINNSIKLNNKSVPESLSRDVTTLPTPLMSKVIKLDTSSNERSGTVASLMKPEIDKEVKSDTSSNSSVLDSDNQPVKSRKLRNKCTLCDVNIVSDPCKHPQLNVLLCKKCETKVFRTGNKLLESNISDYCSWCFYGGSLVCCDSCSRSFCYECIIRNLGHHYLNQIIFASTKWTCFICCTKPIDFLINKCTTFMKQKLVQFEKGVDKIMSPAQKRKRNSVPSNKSKIKKTDSPENLIEKKNSGNVSLQSDTSESSSDDLVFLPTESVPNDQLIELSSSSTNSSDASSDDRFVPVNTKIFKNKSFTKPPIDKEPKAQPKLLKTKQFGDDDEFPPLILESGPAGEVKVKVSSYIARHLKQHQVEGVRFLYDTIVTNVSTWNNTPHEDAKGCILAHCMGLGKTLQIIAFMEAMLNCVKLRTALIVCPLNTASCWKSEFELWLKDPTISVFALQDASIHKEDRKTVIEKWYDNGGILILSYSLYRQYVLKSEAKPAIFQMTIKLCLMSPGPDIVVCDEGHLLKNEKSRIFEALNSIKTRRRIILTGTPMQNNLSEYYSMVNFVRPGVLGSVRDFNSRFKNPIQKGQVIDADEYEVRYMKKRCHVLHGLLKSFVQRKDFTSLLPYLPPKYEYTIYVRSNDTQIKMFKKVLEISKCDTIGENSINFDNLFAIFQTFILIGFHPAVFYINKSRKDKNLADDFDMAVDLELLIKGTPDNIRSAENEKLNSTPQSSIIPFQWFTPFVNESEDTNKIELSGKLMILNQIIGETIKEKQKLVIFSQSLACLDFISIYLNKGIFHGPNETDKVWSIYSNYYRIDGSVNAEQRNIQVKNFNDPKNSKGVLFLISTRAGGLGINLKAATRVILMDCSWNPSNDIQSMFRVYRLGQDKPVFIYRLVSEGVLEERIYNRQITKLALSCRVVDKQQIERHFTKWEINEIYTVNPSLYNPNLSYTLSNSNFQKMIGLSETLKKCFPKYIVKYIEHNSLLVDQPDQDLTIEEQNQAMTEYFVETNGKPQALKEASTPNISNILKTPQLMGHESLLDSSHTNTTHNNTIHNHTTHNNTFIRNTPVTTDAKIIYRDITDNPENYNIPIIRLNINSNNK